jgi:basic amino acid/polyamine antiporter, APA family
MVLRVKEPARPRPFKVPFVWVVAPLGVLSCLYIMYGLPSQAWVRFAWWLLIGLAIYILYGYRHSKLRQG